MFKLKAVDLLTKFGFDDGSLLSDWFEENGLTDLAERFVPSRTVLDEEDPIRFEAVVLGELVKRHLGPLLPPGVELDLDRTHSHNPVRAVNSVNDRAWNGPSLLGIEVEVSSDDVMAIVREFSPLAATPGEGPHQPPMP